MTLKTFCKGEKLIIGTSGDRFILSGGSKQIFMITDCKASTTGIELSCHLVAGPDKPFVWRFEEDAIGLAFVQFFNPIALDSIRSDLVDTWQDMLSASTDEVLSSSARTLLSRILPEHALGEQRARYFIRRMAESYAERRTDVADACNAFLETGKIVIEPEARFVHAKIANVACLEYDTLTTEISYEDANGTWHICDDHTYSE